ncbi:MAG: TlpA disulfide reductase family protein [Myxococcota bacterium]
MRRRSRSAVLTWTFAALLSLVAAPSGALEEGEHAPQFSIELLSGDGQLSLDAYRGKVVYLDFWASWCGPCLVALPKLEKLRRELPSKQFQIVAVNLDRDLDKAREFLRDRSIGYPSGTDPEGKLAESFGLDTMPTSFLIDRNGVVRYVHRGFRAQDIDEIRERIRDLLRRR